MEKDPHYETLKHAFLVGQITDFREIFRFIPENIFVRDSGIDPEELSYIFEHTAKMSLGQTYIIADLIGVDRTAVGVLGLSLVSEGDLEDSALP